MHAWVGRTVRLVSAAALVYACAGKSISNAGDDDGDDDGAGGFGNAGYGGKGGGISVGGKGGTLGKGGTTGKGGSGKGGTIATGGKGGVGTGGGNVAGDGFGGEPGCGGRFVGAYPNGCPPDASCISMLSPYARFVQRNELAAGGPGLGEGGQGGEGGASSDSREDVATSAICGEDVGRTGFLAFDYYMPANGTPYPGFTLLTGDTICGGTLSIIANGTLSEFQPPPRGWWSTQCVQVTGNELSRVVGVAVPHVIAPYPSVRNVRFVTDCECPRQVRRFDTCGDTTSEQECFGQ